MLKILRIRKKHWTLALFATPIISEDAVVSKYILLDLVPSANKYFVSKPIKSYLIFSNKKSRIFEGNCGGPYRERL